MRRRLPICGLSPSAMNKLLVGDRARYLMGWSYLRGRQWPEASQTFELITTTSPLFPSSRALAEAAREGEQLPRKSPALAGLMSAVVPGTGHLYTGRWRNGTIALLLNGAFLAAGALKRWLPATRPRRGFSSFLKQPGTQAPFMAPSTPRTSTIATSKIVGCRGSNDSIAWRGGR